MKNITIKFDFDDMLIKPKVNTEISSRYNDIVLPDMSPIFTAPMDTVVNLSNMDVFLNNNIGVTLPRTIKYEEFQDYIRNKNYAEYSNVFISLGFEELELHYKTNFSTFYKGAHILIDVANGHMQKIIDFAREVKRLRPDIIIMVGNIGNPETYSWYAKNKCVDYIRVGIGNGGGCLTTKQSGVGHPMASLIAETYQEKQKYLKNNPVGKVPAIVADGGMKDYSDIIKAFALGAEYVMIGSIFNKALESCADNYFFHVKVNEKIAGVLFNMKLPVMKHFRGMSTKQAQKAMGKTRFKTSEGVVRYRKVEYRLQGWIENFEHYLRNAMSYADAKTLDDFIGKVDICQITKNAYDRFNK
jgi:NAD(P)H-dependent flavin oxidoreductase YrpB (nitropropane dioxygenase family)